MAASDSAESALRVGAVIAGKYRIVRRVGQGGMGSVYEAENIALGRTLALKFLEPHLAKNPALVERFMREARAAATLTHPNVVYVFDVGWLEDGRQPYMAMELLGGQSLAALVQGGGAPVDRAGAITAQILDALDAAHSKGIIHRDLKPSNVFLLRGDVVKVLDFGISKMLNAGDKLTATGSVLGTPSYMSPEQARGAKNADHRTDIYAVGAILYELLAGVAPYEGDSYNEILFKIATEDPLPISQLRPDVPPAVVAFVHRSLRRNPAERFASAREMRSALLAALGGVSPSMIAVVDAPAAAAGPTGPGSTTPPPTPAAWEITPPSEAPTTPPSPVPASAWPVTTGAPGTADPRSIAPTSPSAGATMPSARMRLPVPVVAGAISAVVALGLLGAFALWSDGSDARVPPAPAPLPPPVARPALAPLAPAAGVQASATASTPAAPVCRYRVWVTTPGASVRLDGQAQSAEIDRPAACGATARLLVEAPGHARVEREIVAAPGVEPALRVRLEPIRARPPTSRTGTGTGRNDAPPAPPVQILEPNPFSQ